MEPLDVSVIVPTYQGAAFVGAALKSVLAQEPPPAEIIVVDDCSRDQTVATVERMRSMSATPIEVIPLETNSGSPARPINVGVERARYDLIAVLEQDDVFLPDKLSAQSEALRYNPQLGMVFGLCRKLGTKSQPGSRSQSRRAILDLYAGSKLVDGCVQIAGDDMLRLIAWHGSIFSGFPGFMFRRSLWEAKGGIAERWAIGADLDFVCWLAQQGPIGFVPAQHYARRLHRGSLSASGVKTHADLLEILIEYVDSSLPWLQTPQTRRSLRRYVMRSAWHAARGGDLRGGWRLWKLANEAFGWRRRSLPDLGMIAALRSAAVFKSGGGPVVEADVERVAQAATRLAERAAK